jgi:hypothetical protein
MADEWGFMGYRTDTDSEMTDPFASVSDTEPLPLNEAIVICPALWGPKQWKDLDAAYKAKYDAERREARKRGARKAKHNAQAESRNVQERRDKGRGTGVGNDRCLKRLKDLGPVLVDGGLLRDKKGRILRSLRQTGVAKARILRKT